MSEETDAVIEKTVELGRDMLKTNDISKFCEAEGGPDKVIEFLSAAESISTISSVVSTSQKILRFINSFFRIVRLVLITVLTACFFWVSPPVTSLWCAVVMTIILLAAFVAFVIAPIVIYYCEDKLEIINPKVEFYDTLSAECKTVLNNFGGKEVIIAYIVRTYPITTDRVDVIIEELYKKWGVK